MKEKIHDFVNNFFYSLSTSYNISKSLFLKKVLTTIMLILFQFTQLYLWRILLNSIIDINNGRSHETRSIIYLVITYIGVFIIINILNRTKIYINGCFGDAVNLYLDNLIVHKVSEIDYEFFDTSDFYDEINDSWNLVNSIKNLVTELFEFIQSFLQLIITFVLLSKLNIYLSLLVIITLFPAVLIQKKINDIKWNFDRNTSKQYRSMEYFKNCISRKNAMEIRIYGLEKIFIEKYMLTWKKWFESRKKVSLQTNITSGLTLLLVSIGEIGIIFNSLWKLKLKKIGVGDVTYYISLLSTLRGNIEQTIYTFMDIKMSYRELNSVRKLLKLEPKLNKNGKLDITEFQELEFRNISFHYPNQKQKILNNCNFVIKKNEKIGLVGLNGVGKSTIVKLILRLYDPVEGTILLNGIDIREYDYTKWNKFFGVLFQDYNRYSLSLRKCIGLSNIENVNRDDLIWKACAMSFIDTEVSSWESKLDTSLTRKFDEQGKELSGGQWQRVALARAFFSDSKFLIMDEPSSSLDPVAEFEIFKLIKELLNNKTALLISHRLSNISACDKIIVMEYGKIIEQGSHNSLMKKENGRYAELFKQQAEKYN